MCLIIFLFIPLSLCFLCGLCFVFMVSVLSLWFLFLFCVSVLFLFEFRFSFLFPSVFLVFFRYVTFNKSCLYLSILAFGYGFRSSETTVFSDNIRKFNCYSAIKDIHVYNCYIFYFLFLLNLLCSEKNQQYLTVILYISHRA